MRGATGHTAGFQLVDFLDFNPHSPCGERRRVGSLVLCALEISIHTPHAGSDCIWAVVNAQTIAFQSTLPMRGATYERSDELLHFVISIHTPHAGSDREIAIELAKYMIFQSTLPMRGATVFAGVWVPDFPISIHTPHAGSDPACRPGLCTVPNFNPHSPCGERRQTTNKADPDKAHFNPHSPCGERL